MRGENNLATLAGRFAQALGVVTQLLHPEVIVIGGGVAFVGERCAPQWRNGCRTI